MPAPGCCAVRAEVSGSYGNGLVNVFQRPVVSCSVILWDLCPLGLRGWCMRESGGQSSCTASGLGLLRDRKSLVPPNPFLVRPESMGCPALGRVSSECCGNEKLCSNGAGTMPMTTGEQQ